MINKIIAKNFLSWENLEFNVNDGISLIDGWNEDDQTPEGSGKSAILNALSWCIYGKLPKDVKIDEVIRRGHKSCYVEVSFDTFSVVRQRGPNKLFIKSDKIIVGKDAKETQKLIEEKIGLSFEAFCQTIYFAQNYPKKFITANQEDKAKILSEIQDLSIFDSARMRVKKDLDETKEAIQKTRLNQQTQINIFQKMEFEIKSLEQEINSFEEKRQLEIKHLNDLIGVKQKEIEISMENIKTMESRMNELNQFINGINIESLNQAIIEIDSAITQFSVKSNELQNIDGYKKSIQLNLQKYRYEKEKIAKQRRELVEFIQNPTDACITCGTVLGEKDTSHAQEELKKVEAKLVELGLQADKDEELLKNVGDNSESINNLNNTINELKNQKNKATNQISVYNNYHIELKNLNINAGMTANHIKISSEKLNELAQQVEIARNKQCNHELLERLETCKKNKETHENEHLKKLEECLNGLIKYQGYYEVLYKGFKDIKVHIFNSLLNELTLKTNNYLQKLFEVSVHIRFINDNRKIKTEFKYDGEERGLGLLSGGQFRRVSLATDLALSEIVNNRTGNVFNIKILDEYFKDLSEVSMQKCLNLLQSLNIRTLLIEHNSIFKSIVDKVYIVKLENGVSKLDG